MRVLAALLLCAWIAYSGCGAGTSFAELEGGMEDEAEQKYNGQFEFDIECPNEVAEEGQTVKCTAEIPGNSELRLPGASTRFDVEWLGDGEYEWQANKVYALGLQVGGVPSG